ncbi:hypothetical protein MMC26_000581 [Xylographa opegraphella]|nr:hypothetical protein [Xylographa opegraphella]
MATLIFQRATWCLQISRTSKTFAVSFTTALPRRHKSGSLPSRSRAFQEAPTPRVSRHNQARSAFTSTKVHQAQQSSAAPVSSWLPEEYFTQQANGLRSSEIPQTATTQDLSGGLDDQPLVLDEGTTKVDWSRSFHGLSSQPFSKEAADILLQPIPPDDVEVKPDGIIYLPEIKYRRLLNKAFGPGAWGLAPRGETIVTAKAVTREYALVVLGRLVSVARGEQDYFSPEGIPTAAEGCKSNALMRCCKDLGVASELWDPVFIRKFMTQHVKEVFVEHQVTKKRKKLYMRKDGKVTYPYKEAKSFGAS